MKDNKKITSLILVLVLTITVILGGTFAYWQWITSTEQQTLVNVSLTDDATILIDFPDNELTNLYPTSDCEANGTSSWVTDITVNNGTGVKLATNFKLKIKIEDKDGNVITNGTNEWNDEPFKYYVKYAVTEENESCKNALYTGRFDSNVLTYSNVVDEDDPHYSEKDRWYDSGLINSLNLDIKLCLLSELILPSRTILFNSSSSPFLL